MIEVVGGVVLVLGFLIFMKAFRLVEKSMEVVGIARSSIEVVRDVKTDDYQKEIAMQKNAVQLLSLFLKITAGSIAAVAIPFGCIWLLELVGVLVVDDVIETTLSWEFIVGTVVVSFAVFYLVWRK